jgi:Transmembrane secretion effector
MNLSRAVGPAIGGVLYAATSAGVLFLINALNFVPVIGAVARWRGRAGPASVGGREHVGEAVRAGARYVAASPGLRVILLRAGVFIHLHPRVHTPTGTSHLSCQSGAIVEGCPAVVPLFVGTGASVSSPESTAGARVRLAARLLRARRKITEVFDGVRTRLAPDTPSRSSNSHINFLRTLRPPPAGVECGFADHPVADLEDLNPALSAIGRTRRRIQSSSSEAAQLALNC